MSKCTYCFAANGSNFPSGYGCTRTGHNCPTQGYQTIGNGSGRTICTEYKYPEDLSLINFNTCDVFSVTNCAGDLIGREVYYADSIKGLRKAVYNSGRPATLESVTPNEFIVYDADRENRVEANFIYLLPEQPRYKKIAENAESKGEALRTFAKALYRECPIEYETYLAQLLNEFGFTKDYLQKEMN